MEYSIQKTQDRRQKTQDIRHKTQDRRHKTEDTRHKTEDIRHQTKDFHELSPLPFSSIASFVSDYFPIIFISQFEESFSQKFGVKYFRCHSESRSLLEETHLRKNVIGRRCTSHSKEGIIVWSMIQIVLFDLIVYLNLCTRQRHKYSSIFNVNVDEAANFSKCIPLATNILSCIKRFSM